MVQHDHILRVRYADTDQMQYVYYGKYAEYVEAARTEMIRELGIPYRELEESGIMMPVVEMNMRYHRPAFYDDELRIRCMIKEKPGVRLKVEHEVYNPADELLVTGFVTLAFIDMARKRPVRAPAHFLEELEKHIKTPT